MSDPTLRSELIALQREVLSLASQVNRNLREAIRQGQTDTQARLEEARASVNRAAGEIERAREQLA